MSQQHHKLRPHIPRSHLSLSPIHCCQGRAASPLAIDYERPLPPSRPPLSRLVSNRFPLSATHPTSRLRRRSPCLVSPPTSTTTLKPPAMPVSVQLNTPLADALNSAIQPKLEQYGWATGGADDAALTEYIILMLVNGKTQEEVTRELSTDLLGLDPNDAGLLEFANWLFSTIDALSAQFGSGDAPGEAATGAAPAASGAPDEDQDMDMSTNEGVAEFNAYVISSIWGKLAQD